ncbi:hypothetical protein B0H19DRAFT_1126711 [Mycena capillaripes]|nr:hypothetical protein B0H19DRAFT_1126711 [Mycena capillaripes]
MLGSSRLAVRVASFPARIVRHKVRAAFPPKESTKPASFTELDGTVDPVLFLQLRQRIIERHNPSSVELDEPHLQLVNKNIFNIRQGLKKRDIHAVRESWEELRRANHLHILTRDVLKKIGQLTKGFLPRKSSPGWNPYRKSFVEEVALTAAAADSTDALNACFDAYLRRGDSKAVLELYEKFQRFPKTRDTPEVSDLNLTEESITIIPPDTHPARVKILLAVVAAHAMENSFQGALTAFLDLEIQLHRPTTEEFLRSISYDPALQNKVKLYVQRLDIAKSVARPLSLSKHVDNLSRRSTPILEELYDSILEAMTEPDAYIAADAQFITSTKSVAMTELIWGSFLAAFLRRENNERAAKLWGDVSKFGIRLGLLTWNMVIGVFSDRGAIKEVLGAWNTISSQGVEPDATTYRALIACLFARKRSTEALQWFKTFETDIKPNSSVEKNLTVYNAVLHGLLHFGRENEETAFSIFREMEAKGPKPDLVSYNTILGYHGRQADFKAMAAVINQMSSAGVTGDVFTFSTILSALLKVGRADAPQMVLSIMRRQGVQASVATYSAIIQSQMQERSVPHLKAAMHLLNEMEMDRDVTPNEITYTSILAGLYRGKWLSAEQIEMYKQDIMARMKRKKISLKTGGYNILIKACLTSGEPKGLEDALAFCSEMARHEIPRTDDTWYIMLAGLIDRGEWRLAREIADEMFSSGARPGNSVLHIIIIVRSSPKERSTQAKSQVSRICPLTPSPA